MYEKIVLPNGIRIVFDPIPFVRSVAFGIWVNTGSRNETVQTNGISHFIEHMLFKGTQKRTAQQIADEMDSVGGQLNAGTSKELTYYYTRVLDTHFDTALDVLCDMFFNSKFDDAEIEKERNVILEEINMYDDSPEDLVHDIMQSSVWRDDPIGLPILGTEESIKNFTSDSFKNHCKENYYSENTVISVAGNFKSSEILKKLELYFSDFKSKNKKSVFEKTNSYTKSIVSKVKDIEQIHLSLAFPSIPRGSEQSYTLNVLDLLFGGGMSSRLFQKIREERGMCYSIYSHNASFLDRGLFSIYAGLGSSQTEEAIKLILEEIHKLKNNDVTKKQLEKSKEQLKSNYILSLESTSNRMSRVGNAELLLNRVLTPDEIIQKIDDVDLDKLHSAVEQIFDLNKMSLSAVGKIEHFDFEKVLN